MNSTQENTMSQPMTEREAFMRAICESPDDDAPRLVFADWLEDHGDPKRARFIRLSCQAARLPEGEREPQDLFKERIGLYHDLDEFVYAELRIFKGIQWMDGFSADQRGLFEAAVVTSPKTLVAEADRVWGLTCLRFLTLQNPTMESLREVMALPQMRCIQRLWITGNGMVCDEAVEAILASPHLTGLKGLGLAKGQITNKGIALLADSPLLDQLRFLNVEKNKQVNWTSEPVQRLQQRCEGRCELMTGNRRPPRRK